MQYILTLILLLIPSSAYAVCHLCVFPILAAAGVSTAIDTVDWLTCLWGAASIDLCVLYWLNRRKQHPYNIPIHHLDVSVIIAVTACIVGLLAGYHLGSLEYSLYAIAGCSIVHISLVLCCFIRQFKKIPYLKPILVNGLLIVAGVLPYFYERISLVCFSGILIGFHVVLYLFKQLGERNEARSC